MGDNGGSYHILSAAGVWRWHLKVYALFSGLVYNVTPYMDYHPGGEDELMKAAGIDGTDLFDQVRKVQV